MKTSKQALRAKTSEKKTRKKNPALLIVGIGASAGGLEALRELLGGLEHNQRLTYVIVQHLSPSHTSMLKTLLSRECRLNVAELTVSQVPQADTIYITPPNWDIVIKDGILRLVPLPRDVGPKPNINRFFTSLAEDQGKNAVGIILSGTGGDGASGLASIKTHGGTTLVQEPASAKYDGMPKAAIQAQAAQIVLPPSKMGEALVALATTGTIASLPGVPDELTAYDKIMAYVKERLGLDLSLYKKSTLDRRIKRRMALKHISRMDDYLVCLQSQSEEVSAFVQDALISVTEFFRDAKAFDALKEVIVELVKSYPLDRVLRIWIPGCATGEEAYSIAILLEEAMLSQSVQRKYQIFATDIDGGAAGKGRLGRYPETSLKKVSTELRRRYFERAGKEYVVSKAIREKIVFSVHNVTQDPPFSRVDLVSCRNLLIYFTPPLQKYVIELFYAALIPGGHLFLGKSEMVTDHADIFLPVSKNARLFKKMGDRRFLHSFNPLADLRYKPPVTKGPLRPSEPESVSMRLTETLSSEYAPPSVVITASDELLHVVGRVQPYLGLPSGPIGLGVFDLVHDKLRAELRALVYKCRREGIPVFGGRHALEGEEGRLTVRCAVRPLKGEPQGLLVVSFERVMQTHAADEHPEPLNRDNLVIVELEHELATTREHLQTVVEQLETSNEELQSLNEELQSSNEELQSTNEELQTANEELQSTNEELLTVNDELQVKSMELEKVATDLQNIQNSIDFPLIVVDRNLKLRNFVPACSQLLALDEINEGDMLSSLPWRCDLPQLRDAVNQVLNKGKAFESKVDFGHRSYQFRALPYHCPDGSVAGVILLFPETTELLAALMRIEQSEQRLKNLVSHIPDAIITTDVTGKILSFSEAAKAIFGYSPEEIEGKSIDMLTAQIVPDGEFLCLGDCILGHESREGKQQIWGRRKDGSVFPLEFSTAAMHLDGVKVYTIVMRDIAERVKGEETLFREKERAQVTLSSIADAVVTTDTEGRVEFMNPVAERLTGWNLNEACGEPVNLVFKIIDEITREPLPNPVIGALSGKEPKIKGTVALRNRHHEEYAIEYSIAPIRNKKDAPSGAVLVFHDVTDKQTMIRHIAWQARHDPLTRLVNRKEMEERLEHALTSAK
ncbi:MAG: PAS domain S-box protein, partial [Nitrospirota bacterium]|nr:PAS domain S-box protein [Nitrospirota bacterium]